MRYAETDPPNRLSICRTFSHLPTKSHTGRRAPIPAPSSKRPKDSLPKLSEASRPEPPRAPSRPRAFDTRTGSNHHHFFAGCEPPRSRSASVRPLPADGSSPDISEPTRSPRLLSGVRRDRSGEFRPLPPSRPAVAPYVSSWWPGCVGPEDCRSG